MAKKQKRASLCTPALVAKICKLIEGGHKWDDIASILDVSRSALFNWKDPNSEFAKPALIEAIAATREKISCEQTKTDQHTQSRFHTLKKVTRERMLVDIRSTKMKIPSWAVRFKSKRLMQPPKMPPSNFSKAETIQYAKNFLDLHIDGSYTLNEIRMECALCIEELTVEVFVKVKEELADAEPSQQAVKNVLTNCGPAKKRWNFDTSMKHGFDETLAGFLKDLEVEGDDRKNQA